MSIALLKSYLPALPSLDSTRSYVDAKAKEISQLFHDHVVYPMGVGAVAGVVHFGFCCALLPSEAFSPSTDSEPVDSTQEAFNALNDLLICSVVPVVEEVLFRVVIQGNIKWVAAKILPNQEVNILGLVKLPLPALVSIASTSIIFGALHYPNGGLPSVFSTAIGGVNLGLLKEKVGLISSCTAHVVANSLLMAV